MKFLIDNEKFLELSSDLAHEITKAKFGEGTETEAENGDIVYTEEAQDFFNDMYDEVQTKLNKIAGLYSIDQYHELN